MSHCITLCFQIPVSDLTVKQLFYTQIMIHHCHFSLKAAFIRSGYAYTLVQLMNTSSLKKKTSLPYFALLH